MELKELNEIAKDIFGKGARVIKVCERGEYIQLALIDDIGWTICIMNYREDSIFGVYSTHSTSLANTVVLRELADFIEKVEGRK